ncbi:MAG: DNA methyltransferase [Gammaproteobacteria bacterium]|nr:DNA methyltransferase [Gammaproteobacteria bacterium]
MTASRANQLSGAEWLKNSFSIWRDLPRDGDRKSHPASFPVSLVKKILDCYAKGPDSLILDPFVGSGSTLLAATAEGMPSIGLDVNAKFKEVFLGRLDLFDASQQRGKTNLWRYEICDARSRAAFFGVVEKGGVDLCVTSPPYWDVLNRRRSSDGKEAIAYSDSDSDIGNISSYEEFLRALGDVVQNVGDALKHRGYLVLNVMDLRKGSQFYPLHQDSSVVVRERGGLVLNDILVWDRQKDYNAMRPLGYPHKFIVNKVHEYLLVFRKEA